MVVRQSGDRRFQRLLGAEAEQHGVAVMGTLRVLELAAERGLIDLPTAITQLIPRARLCRLERERLPKSPCLPMTCAIQRSVYAA
jgi:hypothetical protein